MPQPLEPRLLARRLLIRLRGGDRGGPVLCELGHRHGRINPLPLRRERGDRPQADLGQDESLWRHATRGIPRHHWPDGAQCCRRGCGLRRARGLRSLGPDLPRRSRCRTIWRVSAGALGAKGFRLGVDDAYLEGGVEDETVTAIRGAIAASSRNSARALSL